MQYYCKYLLGCLFCAVAGVGVPVLSQAQASGPSLTKSQARTLSISATAIPPTTEDSVRAAVNELFLAMKNSDAARLRAAFTDSALLQTIVINKEGKTVARNESVEEFATSISKLPQGAADERIRFDIVKIDGPLAIVWAPYSFYFKGNFSHCGIDSFQLLRSGGIWKILYIADTRRKEPCE
ncbi:MAG TPA: nuclear transport factor 2 family protein [Puia sp.]